MFSFNLEVYPTRSEHKKIIFKIPKEFDLKMEIINEKEIKVSRIFFLIFLPIEFFYMNAKACKVKALEIYP